VAKRDTNEASPKKKISSSLHAALLRYNDWDIQISKVICRTLGMKI